MYIYIKGRIDYAEFRITRLLLPFDNNFDYFVKFEYSPLAYTQTYMGGDIEPQMILRPTGHTVIFAWHQKLDSYKMIASLYHLNCGLNLKFSMFY